MLSPSLNGELPDFLSNDDGPSSGYMITQYTAAGLVAELRALAHPVSVDSIVTSDNQEDHVSFGMTAALMTLDALDRLTAVLAIELLCAAQALEHSENLRSDRVATIHRLIRRRIPPLVEDRPPAADIEMAKEIIESGELLSAQQR